MSFYEIDTELNAVPTNFLLPAEDISANLYNLAPHLSKHGYRSYTTSNVLTTFLKREFSFPIVARYQIIEKDIPPHTSFSDQDYKWQFIYSEYGYTMKWWDENNNMLDSVDLKTNVWYKLHVKTLNSYENIKSPILSITVKEDL